MTSSFDDSENYQNKNIALSTHPTQHLQSLKQSQGAAIGEQDSEWIDDLPTVALPTVGFDQMQTLVDLRALFKAPPTPYFAMDGTTALSEQATWIIPVLRDTKAIAKPVTEGTEGQNYVAIIKKLIKSSGIYALASLAAPLASLILSIFLTRYLSHSDYGALVILNTIVALMAGITQLGLNDAFLRAYTYDYETQSDRLSALSTVTMLLLGISIPTAFVVNMGAPWLAGLLLNNASLGNPVRVAAFVILMQNLTIPGLSWLRAQNRPALFSLLTISNLIIAIIANILFVKEAHLGVSGSLLATGSGYALIVACTMPVILLRVGLHLRFDIAKGLLSFGLPHVMNLISGWVLQLSDRYLLGHFGSLSQIASYSIAYSLGGLLAIVISPFSLAWWSIMFPIAKREDARHIFKLVFRWFSFVLLFATFGLSFTGSIILKLVYPPSYAPAAPIIPIIAVSILFNGIFVVVSAGMYVKRKVWIVAAFLTFSALLNVGLNIIFIPMYGSTGAALATLLAYLVLAFLTYCGNQVLYPIPFEIGLFVGALLLGLALYTGSESLAHLQKMYISWAISFGALFLYGGCLILLGLLPSRK